MWFFNQSIDFSNLIWPCVCVTFNLTHSFLPSFLSLSTSILRINLESVLILILIFRLIINFSLYIYLFSSFSIYHLSWFDTNYHSYIYAKNLVVCLFCVFFSCLVVQLRNHLLHLLLLTHTHSSFLRRQPCQRWLYRSEAILCYSFSHFLNWYIYHWIITYHVAIRKE